MKMQYSCDTIEHKHLGPVQSFRGSSILQQAPNAMIKANVLGVPTGRNLSACSIVTAQVASFAVYPHKNGRIWRSAWGIRSLIQK